ncbi:uncharacterized protein EI90DRAFT_3096052 [Cantharellus anzutake]|uniref:uncharacterized protein n=1 Tax=Cantharellus anzutake TaxID=1750568 RepID=UPI00190436B1|nr:uncharacterized protein EI90DRAFT_3096052 [Cantharellus anzutake]KAF8311666.1 hypothetical protein EI90DRAFT_3096052 [Cantharellus anzutake]
MFLMDRRKPIMDDGSGVDGVTLAVARNQGAVETGSCTGRHALAEFLGCPSHTWTPRIIRFAFHKCRNDRRLAPRIRGIVECLALALSCMDRPTNVSSADHSMVTRVGSSERGGWIFVQVMESSCGGLASQEHVRKPADDPYSGRWSGEFESLQSLQAITIDVNKSPRCVGRDPSLY